MDVGAIQSERTAPQDSTATVQNEVAMEDNEILRRLVRLLSKSEEDELFAQDAHRQPSSALHSHTWHRSKSEGDSASVQHLNRPRSVIRLTDTAPLRMSRPPKIDLVETYKDFERSSTKLRAKLKRLQTLLRRAYIGYSDSEAILKIAAKMSIHLENVTNYMKQQIDILAQADVGPPSEVHARNLSSALSSLALSARALGRTLRDSRDEVLGLAHMDDTEDLEFEALEELAQLAESEARSLKDSRANDSLKRISGIHFRQHSSELNMQFAKACEDVSTCLTEVMKSIIPSLNDREARASQRSLLRTGIATLFSVMIAMMLSTSTARDTSTLGLVTSGIWMVSLACGVAAGIMGILGLCFAEGGPHRPSGRDMEWLGKGGDALFLVAAMLFSIGLCATAVRAIVTTFTSLHFIGLFVLFFWAFRSRPSSNRNSRTSSSSDSDERKKKGMVGRGGGLWSSIRNLAQRSIRSSIGMAMDCDGRHVSMRSTRGSGDVESGLKRQPRVVSYRRSAPPIIRVTDMDQETPAPAASTPMGDDRMRERIVEHRSPTSVQHDSAHVLARDDSSSEGDDESEHDLTSLSFSQSHNPALVIPSAQRVSSDSSRSLPALPADAQVARCMAYSPNGMFLCIGNVSTQEVCTIISTDSPAITLGELKLTDIARQIEWSADGEDILLRLTHMIYVWNALPSAGTRRPAIIIHQDSDNVKWLINGDSFLSCKKDILTSFHIDGIPTGVFQLPASFVQDFAVTKDGHRIICLVSNFVSARSVTTGGSTQKLIVYNLDNKAVEQIAPVGRDAVSIVLSTISPDLVLVNFLGTTPPQLWRYRENTDAPERRTSATFLSFKRAMSFKAPSGRFFGYGIFGSADEKLILCLGEVGDMFVFASDSGQPLRHITTSATQSERRSQYVGRERPLVQCAAWDPDILIFTVCMGHKDGSIWQWKVPVDRLNQDSSMFGVINLGDDESILIRPADLDKSVEDGRGNV